MESLGAISENEWSSFNAMYTNEESEFMLQLLNNCPIPNDFHGSSSFKIPSFWPDHESMNMAQVDEGSINSLDNTNTNIYHLSLGSSSFTEGNSYFFPTSSDSNQILVTNNDSMSDYCMGGADIQGNMEEFGVNLPKADIQGSNLLLECEEAQLPEAEPSNGVEVNNLTLKSKKRSWKSGDVLKNKRNVKPRKNQKLNSTSKNDEDNNSAIPRLSSSSCCSEDDESNAGVSSTSDSKGAVAVNANGKARTNRGSATDPQSLYARKRRERINERLRTLQNLVPNGTKVDISTMLDEAVQYVKFLQLQIKLLSSDDLWMYAPLAYNGMDLGLDLNIPMPR